MAPDSSRDHHSISSDLPIRAVELAAEILRASRLNETSTERERSKMMARMMNDPSGKKFTIAMADQVLRIRKPRRAARRLNHLIQAWGLPRYLAPLDRAALKLGSTLASLCPGWAMPLVKSKVRDESRHVIISAEDTQFREFLRQRQAAGIRVNFNQLGEAVLGAHESQRRLQDNIDRLLEPGVNYLSIKLSSIVSQISLTGYQQTIDTIKRRLRMIYEAAIEGGGAAGPKFVNLDMEEYRDLHLTIDVFKSLLSEPAFDHFPAGIVLQAYLPDSFAALQDLTAWSLERHRRTGTDIKIRLVKGANLAMETVEAAIRDWPIAPYHSKLEVDANFKRMLEYATRPEHAQAVRLGVGSHNLFDIALALLMREQRGVSDRVEFEMLEGMANAQATEVKKRSGDCLVYAPVVLESEFAAAIAYLVRRLDENTAPGSFLGALFALEPGSPEWDRQRDDFIHACRLADDSQLSAVPNRQQNRLTEISQPQLGWFHNCADTDFSLPANRQWAANIIETWQHKSIEPIPLQIGGQYSHEKMTGVGHDPSRPNHQAYQFAQADLADVERALTCAFNSVDRQIPLSSDRRQAIKQILKRAAVIFAEQRGDTIGAMLLDAGKNIQEADTEISEAIDFANYYANSLDDPGWYDGTVATPLGVVVVTPPWNFPYAIPAGGVMAALAAGNSVVLKPARESVLVAWRLVQQLWEAGVSPEQLQFLPTVDGETGQALISDARVAAVVLTGSIYTAVRFQKWRPDLKLFAETSGKNAMIISAAADVDLAVKDLVRGAFGHAGQKCSATSLAIVEQEVYDNPQFLQQLKDATESLLVAGSWNPSAVITPVIRPPDEALMRGLTELDEGESWLLQPRMVDDNPCLWTPGIRLGVRPGSWYQQTECFGPVLGLIRATSFAEAIKIQNDSHFGLTGGLHSLDPQEIATWREHVEVGNAYINRTTTGAIVRRQPFGGWKKSCVGIGSKAGGPNYVAGFCHWSTSGLPEIQADLDAATKDLLAGLLAMLTGEDARDQVRAAAKSYRHWWDQEFSRSHDPSMVHGESNDFRYRPRSWHVLRLQDAATVEGQLASSLAALACVTVGTRLEVSSHRQPEWMSRLCSIADARHVAESDEELINRLHERGGLCRADDSQSNGTLRVIGAYDVRQFSPANLNNIPLIPSLPLLNGRLELLNYLREQSVTETVHRYGNLIT